MPRRTPRRRFDRPAPTRKPYDRVLIVCEGAKTEPHYIKGLRDHYKLSTASVEVLGAGNDPLSLVNKALALAKDETKKSDHYDNVYCVFDRDTHAHFCQASRLANSKQIKLARSWPCFEFWILLHFCYTRNPYGREKGKSPADNCVTELRKYIPNYTKNAKGLFDQLLPCLPKAQRNAQQVMIDAESTGEKNPSTEFHDLVRYLQSLTSTENTPE